MGTRHATRTSCSSTLRTRPRARRDRLECIRAAAHCGACRPAHLLRGDQLQVLARRRMECRIEQCDGWTGAASAVGVLELGSLKLASCWPRRATCRCESTATRRGNRSHSSIRLINSSRRGNRSHSSIRLITTNHVVGIGLTPPTVSLHLAQSHIRKLVSRLLACQSAQLALRMHAPLTVLGSVSASAASTSMEASIFTCGDAVSVYTRCGRISYVTLAFGCAHQRGDTQFQLDPPM